MTLLIFSFATQSAVKTSAEEARRKSGYLIHFSMDQLYFSEEQTSETIFDAIVSIGEGFKRIEHVESVALDYNILVHSSLNLFRTEAGMIREEKYPMAQGQKEEATNWLKGIEGNEISRYFSDSGNKRIEGVFPEASQEKMPVMISDQFADLNQLHVGDKIILGAGQDLSKKSDFVICAIFKVIVDANKDSRLLIENENNIMYTTKKAVLSAYYPGQDKLFAGVGNLYIEPDEFKYRGTIINGIYKIRGIDWEKVAMPTADDSTDYIALSVSNVEILTKKIIGISGFSAIMILTLMMMISLKERQYEVGVILSLGETKLSMLGQLLAEMLLIAALAFVGSCGISFVAATGIENLLVSSKKLAPDLAGYMNHHMINAQVLLKSGSLGIVIIIVATALPLVLLMKKSPKRILLHED